MAYLDNQTLVEPFYPTWYPMLPIQMNTKKVEQTNKESLCYLPYEKDKNFNVHDEVFKCIIVTNEEMEDYYS
jgi:hypothetical protein